MLQRREVDFFSTWRLCYGEATGSSKKVSLALFWFLQKQDRKTTCSCAAKSLQQNFVLTRTFKTYDIRIFLKKWLCRYAFFKSIIEKDSVRLVKFILQIEQLPELVCLAKALCSSPLHFLSFFGRWCKQEFSENLSGLVKSCKHAIQNSSEQPFWQATNSTKMKVWDARCHAWPQLDGDAFWLSLDGGLNYQRVPNLCYTKNSTWICLLHLQSQSICLNVASSNLQVSRFLSAPLEPCLSGLTCAALRRTSCQSCFKFSLTWCQCDSQSLMLWYQLWQWVLVSGNASLSCSPTPFVYEASAWKIRAVTTCWCVESHIVSPVCRSSIGDSCEAVRYGEGTALWEAFRVRTTFTFLTCLKFLHLHRLGTTLLNLNAGKPPDFRFISEFHDFMSFHVWVCLCVFSAFSASNSQGTRRTTNLPR